MHFKDLGLSDTVVQAVTQRGYDTPTPIQAEAIPYVLQGRDIFACAQTGTGKTASFILPMLDLLRKGRAKARMPRAIVLEPTRELAAQVHENFKHYHPKGTLNAALLVGGESMAEQERILKKGVDILIATPGRMIDLFERGKLLLLDVKILIIDEADRMLDMGFIPDVNQLVRLISKRRQTLLFSATMPPEIKKLAAQYLVTPKEIMIAPPSRTADTIDQNALFVEPRDKRAALRTILQKYDPDACIVFANRKRDIDGITTSLNKYGFSAEGLHGDMQQTERNKTLANFRAGKPKILVASDVAARGLDISAISLVVNFDVPVNAEDYVHRIGRTGRAGSKGVAIVFVTGQDKKAFRAIQKLINQKIQTLELDLKGSRQKTSQLVAIPTPKNQSKPSAKQPPKTRPPSKPVQGFGDLIPAFMK